MFACKGHRCELFPPLLVDLLHKPPSSWGPKCLAKHLGEQKTCAHSSQVAPPISDFHKERLNKKGGGGNR
jgi:hypothetical protein